MQRWILTVAFVGLGAYCVARCALPRSSWGARASAFWAGLISHGAHVAMCAAMVAMLWMSPGVDRWGLEIALFVAAGLWFLVRATRVAPSLRGGQVAQALTMGAMVWMLASMSAAGMPMTSGQMAGESMPGMPLTGVSMSTTAAGSGGALRFAVAASLGVVAVWWLWVGVVPVTLGLPTARRRQVTGTCATVRPFGPVGMASCQALMAAAMAAAVVVSA